MGSLQLRSPFVASGVYLFPSFSRYGPVVEAVLGGWRANAIVTAQSGAPFTVNLSVDRANIGAGPAQRPDQLGDPNLPLKSANAGALVRHVCFRVADAFHLWQRSAQQRHWSGVRQRGFRPREDVEAGERARSSSAGKSSTC